MKLTENRLKKQRLRPLELITAPEEGRNEFDPKVNLLEKDWQKLEEGIIGSCEGGEYQRCIGLLHHMLYLDPARFEVFTQSTRFKFLFQTLSLLETPIEQNAPDFKFNLLRIQIRDVFPDKIKPDSIDRKALVQIMSVAIFAPQVTAILYTLKRFPSPESVPAFPQTVFDQFKANWKEVWEKGQLEDKAPDKTVQILARIRVIDPEKFEQIQLGERFWTLALGWLKALREELHDVDDVFEFGFNLYILSAGEVRVLPDGRLDIRPKKTTMEQHVPLPSREAI